MKKFNFCKLQNYIGTKIQERTKIHPDDLKELIFDGFEITDTGITIMFNFKFFKNGKGYKDDFNKGTIPKSTLEKGNIIK